MFERNGRGFFGVGKRYGAVSDFAVLSVVTSDCAIGRAIFWGMGDFGGNVRSGDREMGDFGGMGDREMGDREMGDRAIGLRKVDIISTRRLKPRLHKRSPPPRTKKNYLQPTEVGFACVDAVSTAVSSIFGKNPVSGAPPPNKETGFLPKSMGCNEVFRKKPGFWGPAIEFFC